jgi:surfactin synthase thioesterase subunit
MDKWFLRANTKPSVKLRLFCLPYAGGDSSIFKGWSEVLPDYIELVAIQLPGRSVRIKESSLESMQAMVDGIYHAILPLLDRPYLILGHSLGARVAFELIHRLNQSQFILPRHFIASGSRAPHIEWAYKKLHTLPDGEFVDELRQLNGTPTEVLDNRELMQFLMPMLRADFAISDNHVTNQTTHLDCSASVFHGELDTLVKINDAKEWQHHFSKPINFETFSGDHFFINKNCQDYMRSLKKIIRKELMRI